MDYKMIKETAAKSGDKGIPKPGKLSLPRSLPNLALIGVPEGQQNRAPGIMSYPDKFNSDARFIWKKMFEDEQFVMDLKFKATADDQWYAAIMEFMTRCSGLGAVPFANVTHQEQNDAVSLALTNARIALVNFCNGTEMFQKMKISKATFSYHIKERGFGLVAWADVRPIFDPNFEKWLNQAPSPRFIRSTDLKWSKVILPNCHLWVRYVNPQRITVGYEIQVASPVSVPGKRLATRAEINAFVERAIWKPIIRSHKFKDLKGRLF